MLSSAQAGDVPKAPVLAGRYLSALVAATPCAGQAPTGELVARLLLAAARPSVATARRRRGAAWAAVNRRLGGVAAVLEGVHGC
jgi:hypothetical protein